GNTPTIWNESAITWLAVMRKHLVELRNSANGPSDQRALRNLLVNMSLGEYWRRNLGASRRWMWRAILTDPGLLKTFGYYVWGAPLMHACLPHAVAARLVQWTGVDDYRTEAEPLA